ncbi:MAG: cysteine--tRNA ligase, partial [Gammaproteobacteria bacterium]|nr:cysteine--tRNA ligase [Gammaproteobacteria bacterium]
SKSLDNFLTIREILADYPGEVLRYYLLTSHYRSPLNYSDDSIGQAQQALGRLYIAIRGLPDSDAPVDEEWLGRFQAAMNDDFNTPDALSVIHDLATEVNRLRAESHHDAAALANTLRILTQTLGVLGADPELFLQGGASADEGSLSADEINALIARRAQARTDGDYAEADRIRDVLVQAGIVLEDAGAQTQWRRG